jgi:hypothetical protein
MDYVGDQEICAKGDGAGQEAFENKYPAPCVVAFFAVHLADCTGKEASNCGCKLCRAEEKGILSLSFGASVPYADQVEAWSLISQTFRV